MLAVAASIGLAACGGDDDEDTIAATTGTAEETGGAGAAEETVDLTATDFKFNPSDPSVKAGTVTFDVSNEGNTLHNIEVEGPSGEEELPDDIQPGDSGKLAVDLDQPGTYRFYCPVANHEELGMVGEVTVKG